MSSAPQAPTPAPAAGELIDRVALGRAIAWAEAAYRSCDVCAERCHVDRSAGPAGVCGLGEDARIYKEYLHLGEERRLVPSHTIYMTGCNFRCAFCSDWSQVDAPLAHGAVVSPRALAHRIAQRRAEGARNVNFVGGLPDVNVLYILRTLAHVPADTHVVWNTNLWTTEVALDHLIDIVGTWLVDLKFGNDACARKLSRSKNYWAVTSALLTRLIELAAPRGRQVLVRHLLMPGHLECCTRPALAWLAKVAPQVPVNLMTGYLPYRMGGARGAMGRRIPGAEVDEAVRWLETLGFADVMIDGMEG